MSIIPDLTQAGLPHFGHLLTSTIKDIIPRYWSMKGRHVVRRFGWDTHGVPIEYQIDKKHGISGPDAVREMGISKYNEECRAIVMTYADEWKEVIERVGRWVDMENDYKVWPHATVHVYDDINRRWRPWTQTSWSRYGGCSRGSLMTAKYIERIRSCRIQRRYAPLSATWSRSRTRSSPKIPLY